MIRLRMLSAVARRRTSRRSRRPAAGTPRRGRPRPAAGRLVALAGEDERRLARTASSTTASRARRRARWAAGWPRPRWRPHGAQRVPQPPRQDPRGHSGRSRRYRCSLSLTQGSRPRAVPPPGSASRNPAPYAARPAPDSPPSGIRAGCSDERGRRSSGRVRRVDPSLEREAHELDPVVHVQLAEDVLDVVLAPSGATGREPPRSPCNPYRSRRT